MIDVERQVRAILTPKLLLAVYRWKFPWSKSDLPDGKAIGQFHFNPDKDLLRSFYDLIYHNALIRLSKISFKALCTVDFTKLLPDVSDTQYPQQCLGMITLMDQQRILTADYGRRYTRVFFDPLCEKLARQLIALPTELRPDGKQAWLSRGYTVEDWLIRTLWFWAPPVHSDDFMTQDRQTLKDWLHTMRAEIETHSGLADPFAPIEAQDDVDITAFSNIATEGPPSQSYSNAEAEATISDYAFWWIRILNAHFAITDTYGHYPYWVRLKGLEWNDGDRAFMEKTSGFRYSPDDEVVLQQIREDYLAGVWRPLEVNAEYEPSA